MKREHISFGMFLVAVASLAFVAGVEYGRSAAADAAAAKVDGIVDDVRRDTTEADRKLLDEVLQQARESFQARTAKRARHR
jgi:hypothetical protein